MAAAEWLGCSKLLLAGCSSARAAAGSVAVGGAGCATGLIGRLLRRGLMGKLAAAVADVGLSVGRAVFACAVLSF